MLARLLGPGTFVWHHHDHEDELFLGVSGRFRVEFIDRTVEVGPGEFIIVPKGVEHRTVADEEAAVLVFEPAATRNTGNADHSEFTAQSRPAAEAQVRTVYFWNLSALERDLAEHSMSEQDRFRYFLLFSVLTAVPMAIPTLKYESRALQLVDAVLFVAIIGAGSIWSYWANGGSSGRRFLERALSLGWVLVIRFLILVATPSPSGPHGIREAG